MKNEATYIVTLNDEELYRGNDFDEAKAILDEYEEKGIIALLSMEGVEFPDFVRSRGHGRGPGYPAFDNSTQDTEENDAG